MATEQTSTAAAAATAASDTDPFHVEPPTPWQLMGRRAGAHMGFWIGGTFVLVCAVVAIFAPVIAPFDPLAQDLTRRLVPPIWDEKGTWTHPFGTDKFGRDYLSRLIYGGRISLSIGFLAASIAAVVGSILGMMGGYFGGRVDAVVMYLVNAKLSLPGLIVSLSLVAVFGGSFTVLVLVLAFLFWDNYAVALRSVTMQIRAQDFVAAAEAIGASRRRIILSEILPNLMNQVIVILTLEIALAILIEATLSFLGLGIQPPTPSWGVLVAEGREQMFFNPYLITIPGVTIFLVAIAINMMGDGIRDITAPEGRN